MSTPPNGRNEVMRDVLLREQAAVEGRINAIAQEALDLEFELDGVPASSYGQDQALNQTLDGRLELIESALARLEEGTYGMCADCGSEIPPRRLEALPFATLCVRCQSEADKKHRVRV